MHLAGVRDVAAGVIKLYVNGALEQSVAYTSAVASDWQFPDWSRQVERRCGGLFLRSRRRGPAFDHALTDAEIAASAKLTTNLVASYGFDEGGGTTAGDAVGGQTLALNGAGWTSGYAGSGRSRSMVRRQGDDGRARQHRGQLLRVRLGVAQDTTAFTPALARTARASAASSSNTARRQRLGVLDARLRLGAAARPARLRSSPPPWVTGPPGRRPRRCGRQLRLYVNGRLAGTAPTPLVERHRQLRHRPSPLQCRPGRLLPWEHRQVRVWSRALSDADVRSLV